MTAQKLTIETPRTGKDIATVFDKDFASIQKQYRRVHGDTLPIGQTTDIHFLNVCKCYPEHPLSITMLGHTHGQADKTDKQTDRHLYAVQTSKQTSPKTGFLLDILTDNQADNQADNVAHIGISSQRELEEQKAHYEQLIENHRSELKKMASDKDEMRNNLNNIILRLQKEADTLKQTIADTTADTHADVKNLRQTIRTLQTDTDNLARTITNLEADKQTLQTDTDTLRQTIIKLETDKQTDTDKLTRTIETLQTELSAARAGFKFRFRVLVNAELEAINVFSIAFALYGFYINFQEVGLFLAIVMSLFLKNTIRNMKSSKAKVVAYGMNVAIFIECVFGVFHFTTFFTILEPIEDKLLIPSAGFVAFVMAAIFSGLSISSLRQQNNQVK